MTLKRTTGLKRTAFARSDAKEASAVAKIRRCAVKSCRQPFTPDRPFITWCSPDCGTEVALAKVAKAKEAHAKAERAKDRRKKRESKTLAERAEPVRKLAQRYAVLRDWNFGCISCDKGAHWTGGKWHGSHFKSVGSNSALQFNLWNINKACDQCNYFNAGNIGPYETRLRQKCGDERVDWLKNHPRSRDYPQDYLDRLARILRKKIRRQEVRLGLR